MIGKRVYTLGKSNGGSNDKDAFHFLGKSYVLDESEEVSQLETSLFTAKRTVIEEMMSRHIQREFIDKIKNTKTELNGLQNYYESIKDATIERFIMVDVFNEYNHENKGIANSKAQTAKWDSIPQIGKMPSVADLISREDSLNLPVNYYGFIAMGNQCYALYENGGQRNESNGYLIFRRKILNIERWMPLEELCILYGKGLTDKIISKADEHSKQFAEILAEMNNEKIQLNSGINQKKSISGRTQGRRGEIGFRKLREGEYEVSAAIPPYIIEKDGGYYAFGAVTLGINIKTRNDRIMIEDAPKVLNMPYVHPFVWDDGKICYGDFQWVVQRGVRFNYWYNLSNRKRVAKRIAEVMREGKKKMEHGYVGHDFSPVRILSNCNCKITENKRNAEIYARAHGIKLERIIKND